MATATKGKNSQGNLTEDKYFNLIEHAADGIAILQDGVFKLVNTALIRMSGYDKKELLGMPFTQILTPQSQKLTMARYQARLASKKVRSVYEIKAVSKDGKILDIEINAALTEYEGRVADEIIIRDITERKQAEKALADEATRRRILVDQSRDGIVVLDQDGKVYEANKQFADMLGYTAEEVRKLSVLDWEYLYPPEQVLEMVRTVDEAGDHFETKHRRKDGSTYDVEISTNGAVVAGQKLIFCVCRDITERKQAEEREDQLQQELNMAGRLASIGQLAAGVAHEINNPLTGVIGFSHLMLSRDIPDDMKQDLQVIHSEAQRVAKIVENLLVFAHQRKTGREYIAINDIITRVLELRAYEMKVNNIEVENQLDPNLPATVADAGQLQQVFLNIILNAEHFMVKAHNRGKLLVKTERIDGKIRVSFTDDGAGIGKENLDKIFNPFFTTKEVGNGTGLGLSVCHGIITQHKGRIYAQSELGKGATFVIELPVVAEPAQADKATETPKKSQKPRESKILVVDDEAAILTFLRRLLTDMGHNVETINNADTALERLKTERYSLILLDIKLPGMSGIELYQQIEKIAPALTRRVMFITGDIMEGTTHDFLEKAGVPHITKPIDIEELKKMMNSILTGGLQRLTA